MTGQEPAVTYVLVVVYLTLATLTVGLLYGAARGLVALWELHLRRRAAVWRRYGPPAHRGHQPGFQPARPHQESLL